MNTTRRPCANRGAAYILALILLAVLAALAASFASGSRMNLLKSDNLVHVQSAQFQAESGLAFAVREIRRLALPHDTDYDNAIANIATALAERFNGTGNLGSGTVTCDGTKVSVPRIQLQDGGFEMYVVQQPDKTLTLVVQGAAGTVSVSRAVAMDMMLQPGHPNSVFNYGLASRGAISISGNGEIRGKNEMTEASVISTTDDPVAVAIGGNAIVDGDISTVGDPTSVVLTGTPTIAGSQDPAVIAEHIHFGVEPPVFPEVDTSIFKPLAPNIVNKSTDTSQPGSTFENILIKAGTNPTFASDVTVNGVIYIESPNIVTFAGKVTMNGLVATDDTDASIEACKLTFAGQVEAFGVDALPGPEEAPQFAAVKQLTGTFIVAPGFDVNFAGQFTTINGTVAADRLSFSGQAEGTVKGSVIGLADYPTAVSGMVDIYIDQSGSGGDDAGFHTPMSLEVDPKTYREVTLQITM